MKEGLKGMDLKNQKLQQQPKKKKKLLVDWRRFLQISLFEKI